MKPTHGMDRYRVLVAAWMAARESAGGKLTQAEEVRRLGEVDRVWVMLSEEEQDALESNPVEGSG